MALTGRLADVSAATTAGADAAAKTLALVTGLLDAQFAELCDTYPLTANQQNKGAAMRAAAVEDIAELVTALEVA